jgi:hypothetical protein
MKWPQSIRYPGVRWRQRIRLASLLPLASGRTAKPPRSSSLSALADDQFAGLGEWTVNADHLQLRALNEERSTHCVGDARLSGLEAPAYTMALEGASRSGREREHAGAIARLFRRLPRLRSSPFSIASVNCWLMQAASSERLHVRRCARRFSAVGRPKAAQHHDACR